jgi:hypothetical protein
MGTEGLTSSFTTTSLNNNHNGKKQEKLAKDYEKLKESKAKRRKKVSTLICNVLI